MLPTIIATTLAFGLRTDPGRLMLWEREVVAIEKRLAESPPKSGGILFAGSSTIRLWKLDNNFPEWHATNTGFGGSEIREVTYFAPRIILPHAPKTIIFYAGDNDIGTGRKDSHVLRDFRAFVYTIHAKLPQTRILFLAIKPSVKRWNLYPIQERANAAVKAYCEDDPRLGFIDTVPVTLGDNGQPRVELLQKDGLHLNDDGYAAWATVVKRAMAK
jgi:lysophospholipase L1-like esterase